MSFNVSSNTAESLMTAVYGTTATVIGVVTIYQGRKAWAMWYEHHHAGDVELGHPAPVEALAAPSNTSVEGSDYHSAIDVPGQPVDEAHSAFVAPTPLPQQASLPSSSTSGYMATRAPVVPGPVHTADSGNTTLAGGGPVNNISIEQGHAQ